ncbi:MAG TPA: hypothetical protein VK588_02490 [Chitinophagaceae bacterium]|nr:hypothetical protein [Chitinophagaceae bacterium]
MERKFNNEFERFLKENADQYRLYPSSKVWNGIYTALHTRRKWFGLGIALLLITGTLVTFLITHSSKETTTINTGTQRIADKPEVQTPSSQIPVTSNKNEVPNRTGGSSIDLISVNSPLPLISSYNVPASNVLLMQETGLYNKYANGLEQPVPVNITDELTDQDIINTVESSKGTEYPKSLKLSNPYNLTIESVLNSFTYLRRDKKFSVQYNLTPTISYRKLSENKSFPNSNPNVPSSYVPLYDINSVVTHKPDLGLEFGVTTKYALGKNLRLKAGLQFNLNRYDIKAFNSSFEVAKIDLRGSRGVDSFYALSTHRNFNGFKSDWLQNFYFEISMPVGVEINIIGDDKVQFGVAGTIQPTYVIGDRAYLLSTDYKNYAEVPWLIRRWNINTGFETFVSYSTGKMKWQVGPQVRYQLLSSFIAKYPVKENLFDFGLKVGVSINK